MITSTTFAVMCDSCRKAFAYPRFDGQHLVVDAIEYLTEHGWTCIEDDHICPRCSWRFVLRDDPTKQQPTRLSI